MLAGIEAPKKIVWLESWGKLMMIGSERGQRDERTWIDLTLVPLDTDADALGLLCSWSSLLKIKRGVKMLFWYFEKITYLLAHLTLNPGLNCIECNHWWNGWNEITVSTDFYVLIIIESFLASSLIIIVVCADCVEAMFPPSWFFYNCV